MRQVALQNQESPPAVTNISKRKRFSVLPYVFIFPLVIFIGGFAVYPTISTFFQSFYNVNPLDPPERFVGLKNYFDVFSNDLVNYNWANTGIYVLFGVSISFILSLVIALGLWENFKGRAVVLAILILPWALPGVTEGIIWNWIYDPSFGVLNSFLKQLHLINDYHIWISGNRFTTIFFIELVQIWQTTPLCAILILASLQQIPTEIYDAAKVDGSSKWKTFWFITFPLIRPGVAIAVVQALIGALNIFDQPYVLNGNAKTGSAIMIQTYNITFQNLNFGQGYALSFITVFITMLISVGLLRLIYRKVEF